MLNQSLCAILTYNTQATFTGRIHMIASFLPFSDTETAVVLHKFFLDYQDRLHLNLDLSPDIHRYLAHIDLEAVDDGSMFSKLAKKHHNPQLSARSLDKAMERRKVKLTNEYKDTHELVSEDTNKRPLEKYRLKFLPNLDDIVVHKIEEEEDEKEKERLTMEKLAAEKLEKEKQAKKKQEKKKKKQERERLEREKLVKRKLEVEKMVRENLEKEKQAKEKQEQEKLAKEKREIE
jgi:hypothetical protein